MQRKHVNQEIGRIRAIADETRALMRPNDVEYRAKAEFLRVAQREIGKLAVFGYGNYGRGL